MNALKISHALPQQIIEQYSQLEITINEISGLIEKKKGDFNIEESSIDFVELDVDHFEYENEYIESNLNILNGIMQTLYNALFVSIYSHLETNLAAIIKELEIKTDYKIKSKHLKRDGSFMNSCFNYLKLVQNLDLKDFNERIKYLNAITLIRNTFTHTRGFLPKESNKTIILITEFIDQNEGIEIDNGLITIKNEKFIDNTLQKNKDFLIQLINFINQS